MLRQSEPKPSIRLISLASGTYSIAASLPAWILVLSYREEVRLAPKPTQQGHLNQRVVQKWGLLKEVIASQA